MFMQLSCVQLLNDLYIKIIRATGVHGAFIPLLLLFCKGLL